MNVRFTGLFQIRRECSEYGIIYVRRQVLVIYLTGSVGQVDPVFLRVFPDDFMRLSDLRKTPGEMQMQAFCFRDPGQGFSVTAGNRQTGPHGKLLFTVQVFIEDKMASLGGKSLPGCLLIQFAYGYPQVFFFHIFINIQAGFAFKRPDVRNGAAGGFCFLLFAGGQFLYGLKLFVQLRDPAPDDLFFICFSFLIAVN